MSDADVGDGAAAPPQAQDRLSVAADRLRQRAVAIPLERALFIAGSVLLPLGAVLILLGWWGASHTTRLYEQIPYTVSGGMLGMGLMFGGGFAYFAHWLTKLVEETRDQSAQALEMAERTADALDRIDAHLRGGTPTAMQVDGLLSTPSGALAHRPDCPVVANRDDLRSVQRNDPAIRPCKICQPDLATTR